MNGLELIIREARDSFLKGIQHDLVSIISVGSAANQRLRLGWSDLDLLLVFDKLDNDACIRISEVVEALEYQLQMHVGINAIDFVDFTTPKFPTLSLEGKTLQALYELTLFPERLLYLRNAETTFYYPSAREVREFSLISVLRIALESRRKCLAQRATGAIALDRVNTRWAIRNSFIASKMLIQYMDLVPLQEEAKICERIQSILPNVAETLGKNLADIVAWEYLNDALLQEAYSRSVRAIEVLRRHIESDGSSISFPG